jgi:hypothetical protein
MRKTILVIALIALYSCHKATESKPQYITRDSITDAHEKVKLTPDSVSIVSSIADTPFDQNNHNMNYFIKKLDKSTKVIKTLKTNNYDESITDTISTIYWGETYIKKLNNTLIDESVLLEVHVVDDKFTLTNGIAVGQQAINVFKTLKAKYNNDRDYKFLELRSQDNEMGFINHLKINFKNNIVSEIIYLPSLD